MKKKRRVYASSLTNVAQCPSFDWKENSDKSYADRGTKIHEALENQDPKDLPTEDLPPFEYGMTLQETYYKDHFDEEPTVQHEASIYLPGIGNCKIDYSATSETKALVIDWKTGITAHYAATDLQGKAYALAMFTRHKTLETVVICFADLDIKRTSEATFTRSQVSELHAAVYSTYYAATAENPARTVCDVCSRCEHATTCPEYTGDAKTALTAIEAPTLPDLTQVRNWTPAQKGLFLDRLKQAKDVLKQIESEIRSNATGEDTPTGYTMAERQGNRQVQDVRHAVEVLMEMELPEPVIDSCLNISLGDLERAYVTQKRAQVEEAVGKLPRGFISQAKNEFYEALKSKGLITRGSGVTYLKKESAKTRELSK